MTKGICSTRSRALHCGYAIGQGISAHSAESSDNRHMKGKEKRPLRGVLLGDFEHRNEMTQDALGRHRRSWSDKLQGQLRDNRSQHDEPIDQCTQNTREQISFEEEPRIAP